MSLPARPKRQPLASWPRPSDGATVEVWATTHTSRSHDRTVSGTRYYRALIAVGGQVVSHAPQRHRVPEDVVTAVKAMFHKGVGDGRR